MQSSKMSVCGRSGWRKRSARRILRGFEKEDVKRGAATCGKRTDQRRAAANHNLATSQARPVICKDDDAVREEPPEETV